jgi:hypothetical protein
MTRYACLLALILLAACSTGAAKFAGPDKSAPVWDLNPGKWEDTTNDLIHEPSVKPVAEASHGQVGL